MVATTVYKSINLQPQNVAINANLPNIFSCLVDCTTAITQYQLIIWKVSDNSLIYNSGVLTLSTPLYSKETLTHNLAGGTLTNGIEYKFVFLTKDGVNTATSDEVAFITNATATITFIVPATITTPSYKFSPIYNQSDGVGVEYVYYVFYDANDKVLIQTDKQYTSNISYTFEGFVDNTNYKVKLFGRTQNSVLFESSLISFYVDYSAPSVNLLPTVTQDCKTGNVTVVWGKGVVIVSGTSSGTISYTNDWYALGNKALLMNSGASVNWNLGIPQVFHAKFDYQKQTGFTTGKIAKLTGTGQSYEFGYDSSVSRFYIQIGVAYGYSDVMPLPTIPFEVILRPTDAYIKVNDTITRIYVRSV